ncbi:MAG: diguanylate cyclase [Sulfuricella sp.]|nr:diguanylate cyclase [Sulfuricella sp.]
MQTDLSIARSLSWRYLIALMLVATMATAAWISLRLVISEQKSTAAVVNISGRQRMLSQRTALYSSLLLHTPKERRPQVRSELAHAADLMRRSHLGLLHGDAEMGLPPTMSPAVHALYFDGPAALDSQVNRYLEAVRTLLQAKDADLTPDNTALQYIITIAPNQLVQSLDQMVNLYQAEGEAAISRLQTAETVVWLLTLLLLVLEAAFIFEPFARQIRRVIDKWQAATDELRDYQGHLEELVRQRTLELQKKGEALTESEEKFRLISTSAKDAILIIDQAEAIVYWNPAAAAMFGYPAEQALGKHMHDLLAPPRYREDIERGFAEFCRTGTGPLIGLTSEVTALRSGGEEFPIELSISTLPLDGRLHALGIIRDITERVRMENELRELANTDFLTGLPNRRHFLAHMEEQLARLQRLVTQHAAVLILDLDHFKRINDTYGHATGDAMLSHVAALMRDDLRKIDMAGRVGGEEFAFILPGTNLAGAQIFAERLRGRVEETPLAQDGRTIPITVSIGVAAMDTADACTNAALVRADEALYRAKNSGRNRVEVAGG